MMATDVDTLPLDNVQHHQTPSPFPELPPSIASTPTPKMSAGKPTAQTRQKRVLPSRSRRGGPGVGSCDADLMILETLRRKRESEPLIPATTQFLLTTDPSLVASSSKSTFELNDQAYVRYFDRPEVRKAYKEQQLIQTPEFTQLSEDVIVGGRFRPREQAEDDSADTSDAAYEKRHRKYETFEKRQRLREKEKLKHEQYKLKERIDQLRAMDASAFLTLSASDFPEPPQPSSSQEHDDDDENAAMKTEPHDAHTDVNIAAPSEGERRRKAMLEVALSLEERYRVLLPTDRKWLDKKSVAPESTGTSASFRRGSPEASEDEDEDEDEEEENVNTPEELPRHAAVKHHGEDESEADGEERERERSKGLKLRIKFPPRSMLTSASVPGPTPKHAPKYKQKTLSPFMAKSASKHDAQNASPSLQPKGRGITNIPGVVIRSADGKFLPKNQRYAADAPTNGSDAPPHKRQRRHSTVSIGSSEAYPESVSAPAQMFKRAQQKHAERAPAVCMLVLAAERNAQAPTARKTQRHVTAFGTRVPQEIEEVRDFEIPAWVLEEAGSQDDQQAADLLQESASQDQWDIDVDEDDDVDGGVPVFEFSDDSEARDVRDELVHGCPSSESLQESGGSGGDLPEG